MKKSAILYILILALLFSLLSPMALATEAEEETTEATTEAATEPTQPLREPDQCGEDMVWAYEDGTLTITGTGLMDDFPEDVLLRMIDEAYDALRSQIIPKKKDDTP